MIAKPRNNFRPRVLVAFAFAGFYTDPQLNATGIAHHCGRLHRVGPTDVLCAQVILWCAYVSRLIITLLNCSRSAYSVKLTLSMSFAFFL